MSKRFAGDYESFQRFNEKHKITYCDLEAEVWEAEELLKEKDAEIEKLRNSKQNLGVALGKMTVKFANSFDRAEEAEIKESTAALEIILLKSKLKAAEQKVAEYEKMVKED